MEYANQTADQLGRNDRGSRPMDQIGDIANTAYQLSARVQAFLDRFHGESPEVRRAIETAADPVRISYANQFSRLNANMETLAAAIERLDQIG